jgi:hypothetical protein
VAVVGAAVYVSKTRKSELMISPPKEEALVS